MVKVSILIPVDKFAFHPDEVIDEESEEFELPKLPTANGEERTQLPFVIIVEDNIKVGEFITRELSPYFQTSEAEDGKDGLFLALKRILDLIISDVMMPEMDGYKLCRLIKSDELTSHIPEILLTAAADDDSHLVGIQSGVNGFILKPFKTNQLITPLKKLIELRAQFRIRYSSRNSSSSKDIAISSTNERFLEKIQEIVDNNLPESTFTVDEFSKKLGMSRMQLHRKLTALTGLSTSAYMRDQRLRMALQLLEKSGNNVSEIAYAVGFSSPSYFIKCFKEVYHMTPNLYNAQQSHVIHKKKAT